VTGDAVAPDRQDPPSEGAYVVAGVAMPHSLDLLHDLLEQVGHQHPDVSVEDLWMLETAVIEIAGNLIEHGRPAGAVDYQLRVKVLPDRLEGLLADSGEALPGPVTGREMPDQLAEDGRGLLLAEAVLDELSYQRTDSANTWRMVRNRR